MQGLTNADDTDDKWYKLTSRWNAVYLSHGVVNQGQLDCDDSPYDNGEEAQYKQNFDTCDPIVKIS
jgi:hypothetical protein